jgi:hypothetical protein
MGQSSSSPGMRFLFWGAGVTAVGLPRARSCASLIRGFVTSLGARGASAKMISSSVVNRALGKGTAEVS